MKLYVVREIDAFGDSYSYYVHAENEEQAKEIAIKRIGLTIEQLTEIKEISEDIKMKVYKIYSTEFCSDNYLQIIAEQKMKI
jgi:hypothetical protein